MFKVFKREKFDLIQYSTPNAAAFRLMQEKLKVPFEQMVYVGDNIQKDFIAPDELGILTIFYSNSDGIYFSQGY